jgi:ABC-type multidrug transport system permease subunit
VNVLYLTDVDLPQALFIGFSFYNARNTIQGLQNQMYAVMMLLSMFGQLSEQIMPQFINQREVYEARERPSKIYDWKGTESLQ